MTPTPPPSHPPSRTIGPFLTHVTHPQVSPPVGLRQSSFVMNKRKQVKKLGGDASRQDFKIEVSPSRENVNIECSTGFYAQVVIPSIRTLKIGDTEKVAGLHVFCKDIIGKIDAAGSSVNTVLHFRFNHDKECVGGVAVHLHHTTRLVQVQGSSILPDKSHVPIWFVENYFKQKISLLANMKGKEVSAFNQAVKDMAQNYLKTTQPLCAGCNAQFNGRSVPEFCQTCSQFYHKQKCYPSSSHLCYIKQRSRSRSTLPVPPPTCPPGSLSEQSSSQSSPLEHQGLGQSLGLVSATQETIPATSGVVTPADPTCTMSGGDAATTVDACSNPTVNTSAQAGTQSELTVPIPDMVPSIPEDSSVAHPSLIQQACPSSTRPPPSRCVPTVPTTLVYSTSNAVSTLNPAAPPFAGLNPPDPPPQPRQTGTKKKTKQVPTADPKGLADEYTKYAINTAKTRICEQENEINELKFRNKILEDRIAGLERMKKQEIDDKIYHQPVHCRPSHCCLQAHPNHCNSSHSPATNDNKLEKVILDIQHLCKVVTDLVQRVDTLFNNHHPSSNPSHPTIQPQQVNTSTNDDQDGSKDTSAHSIDYHMSDMLQTELEIGEPLN